MNTRTPRKTLWFYTVAMLTATMSLFSAILMTEPGQSLNLPREWLVAYYANRWFFISLNVGLLSYLWYLHRQVNVWRNRTMTAASAGVVTCVIAANFLLAAFFPSLQYDANYVSIQEANNILNDEDVIYAVEINGDVRGYPREHLMIPHIAGDNIGGKDVTMTFCALSNLPIVIEQDIGTGPDTDLGILIQTNNNLVMVERNSGELIQQITMQGEFTELNIKTHANTMMTWADFKDIYPEASVFLYDYARGLDKFLMAVFDKPMQKQFSDEHGPIFPTLDLADDRVGNKEQVWGIDNGEQQIAFTREFAINHPTYLFDMDGKTLVMVYDLERDILNVFDATDVSDLTTVKSIDVFGNTEDGRLEQVAVQNGVFWMVWAHWFPETQVMR